MEILLQFLDEFLMFLLCLVDALGLFLAVFCTHFQVTCQFDANFIKGAISRHNTIDDIYHLVENLFHYRIAEAVMRKEFKARFQFFVCKFLLSEGTSGMAISSLFTSLTIVEPLVHERQQIANGFSR